jgi:hypothetical protein
MEIKQVIFIGSSSRHMLTESERRSAPIDAVLIVLNVFVAG